MVKLRSVINGEFYLVLPMDDATEQEVRDFCGQWLVHIRPSDNVACLRTRPDSIVESQYAAPWRSDVLVKPADAPWARPLIVHGDLTWAVKMFGIEPKEE